MKDIDYYKCFEWKDCDVDCDNCSLSPAGGKFVDKDPKLTDWLDRITKVSKRCGYSDDVVSSVAIKELCYVVEDMAREIGRLVREKK